MVAVPVYNVLKSINSKLGCYKIHVVKFWQKTVKFSEAHGNLSYVKRYAWPLQW